MRSTPHAGVLVLLMVLWSSLGHHIASRCVQGILLRHQACKLAACCVYTLHRRAMF